jgi:hypothetical protein
MNIVLFFCEHAFTRPDGKLDVDGIFSELYAPGFPARQGKLILAGIIEWDRGTHGKQPFTIHLLDPDHQPVFTIDGHSEVDERSDSRPPARTHLILPLENLVFTKSGQYQVRIKVSNRQFSGPSLHLMNSSREKYNP